MLDWILTQNNPVKFVDPDGLAPDYSGLEEFKAGVEAELKSIAQESVNFVTTVAAYIIPASKAVKGFLKNPSGDPQKAAHAARTQRHNSPNLTDHAKKRMVNRNVSQDRVVEAADKGDIVGNRGPVVERNMPASRSESGRSTTVAQDVRTNNIITVIDKGSLE